MSKMKSDRKPPLAKSPIRIRPHRVLRTTSASMQTPPGSLTKSQKPIRSLAVEEAEIRPEYRSISCDLSALAKMVWDELRTGESEEKFGLGETNLSANSTPLFERGRFYDEYSARRNERLVKKRKSDIGVESKTGSHLGVTIESSKKRESKKRESLRKSMSAAYSMERNEIGAHIQTPRYQLRSMSKENKKPPLAVSNLKSVIGTERKTATRRVRD